MIERLLLWLAARQGKMLVEAPRHGNVRLIAIGHEYGERDWKIGRVDVTMRPKRSFEQRIGSSAIGMVDMVIGTVDYRDPSE